MSSLRDEILEFLSFPRGKEEGRGIHIAAAEALLQRAADALIPPAVEAEDDHEADGHEIPNGYHGRVENTPVRSKVAKWKYGACKRCLENGVADGDVVVKIHGIGWFHDACFRVVRPAYYRGM